MSNTYTKVTFLIDGTQDTERLWATEQTPGTYTLQNCPVLVSGYAAQDVVTATPDAHGTLIVQELVADSGNGNLIIHFPSKVSTPAREKLFYNLHDLGLESEHITATRIAFVVPPNTNALPQILEAAKSNLVISDYIFTKSSQSNIH